MKSNNSSDNSKKTVGNADRFNDYAKDGGGESLPRCTTFFNRIHIESLKVGDSNAMHLGEKFLAALA